MHTSSNIAKDMLQVGSWSKENQSIPEEHITAIAKSAMDLQSGVYSTFKHNSREYGAKPFKLWIPHREGELENVLSLAGIHSANQNQDSVFNHVKNVIVYMVHEPEHILDLKEMPEHMDHPLISWMGSCLYPDDYRDAVIKKDWDRFKRIISEQLSIEKSKREKRQYDQMPQRIVPFHDFHGEHLHGVYSILGQATAGANIKTHELGYYTQFHVAYRATVAWHDFYGNKFHPEGKWYPYVIQMLGTHPESLKSSLIKHVVSKSITDTSVLINPNDPAFCGEHHYEGSFADESGVMHLNQHQKYIKKRNQRTPVPRYQKQFFHEHYGQYSSDPKSLFKKSYQGKARVD